MSSHYDLPQRVYNEGEEPIPQKNITHYAQFKLISELKKALQIDEWNYLKNSSLGVCIKFFELNFKWSSKIVHYILSLQLVCNRKYEIWSLVRDQPLRFSLNEFESLTGLNCDFIANPLEVETTQDIEKFWGKLGLKVNVGPSAKILMAACRKCKSWSKNERIKLGFLCILASTILVYSRSTSIPVNMARLVMNLSEFEGYPWGRVAFQTLICSIKKAHLSNYSYVLHGFVQVVQIWVYMALPEFGLSYGGLISSSINPPILRYTGGKCKNAMEIIKMQKEVSNFRVMPYEKMNPIWSYDVEDDNIQNVIDIWFGKLSDLSLDAKRKRDGKEEGLKKKKKKKKMIDLMSMKIVTEVESSNLLLDSEVEPSDLLVDKEVSKGEVLKMKKKLDLISMEEDSKVEPPNLLVDKEVSKEQVMKEKKIDLISMEEDAEVKTSNLLEDKGGEESSSSKLKDGKFEKISKQIKECLASLEVKINADMKAMQELKKLVTDFTHKYQVISRSKLKNLSTSTCSGQDKEGM